MCTEDLFRFEESKREDDLATSVEAWSTVLEALGVPPLRSTIESVLLATGQQGAYPPVSTSKAIFNPTAVSQAIKRYALKEDDPEIAEMFRPNPLGGLDPHTLSGTAPPVSGGALLLTPPGGKR